MDINSFLQKLTTTPDQITFDDSMAVIEANYDFTPTAFKNGEVDNAAGSNNGSCKIFAFGLLHRLSKQQTLACFGDYYRQDVLAHPDGNDHQNIRQFMIKGWSGIAFEADALVTNFTV